MVKIFESFGSITILENQINEFICTAHIFPNKFHFTQSFAIDATGGGVFLYTCMVEYSTLGEDTDNLTMEEKVNSEL